MIGRVETLDVFLLERRVLRSLEHVLNLLMSGGCGASEAPDSRKDAKPKRRRTSRPAHQA